MYRVNGNDRPERTFTYRFFEDSCKMLSVEQCSPNVHGGLLLLVIGPPVFLVRDDLAGRSARLR